MTLTKMQYLQAHLFQELTAFQVLAYGVLGLVRFHFKYQVSQNDEHNNAAYDKFFKFQK